MIVVPPPRGPPEDTLEEAAHEVEIEVAAAGGRVDLVVSALHDDNPDGRLQVVDRGDSVVIRARHSILLTAATLLWHTGSRTGLSEVCSMVISPDWPSLVNARWILWAGAATPGHVEPDPPRRWDHRRAEGLS